MKCGYRNCVNEIILKNKKDNYKKYCCSSCQMCEKKYRSRRKKNDNPKVGRPKTICISR